MIIYLEKSQKENEISKQIISNYKNAKVLEIDNYKNIFDITIPFTTQKTIIIAWVNNPILTAPPLYGHAWEWYFLKNSINCVYDCKYCYLKWAFKNEDLVFFVNYDHMKQKILETISKDTSKNYWFYSSDYSDNLATDNLTSFCSTFIPFFDTIPNAKMEIRTKSTSIQNLLKIKPSKNVEIAFSLNPQEIISKYELYTPNLDKRIDAINELINAWWQVWIRFLPLLEVDNYKEIYKDFLEYVVQKIDFSKIYSVFIWGLLYTQKDYNKILQKEPFLDLLYKLESSKDWFVREKKEVRDYFYKLFEEYITSQKCNICLDEI